MYDKSAQSPADFTPVRRLPAPTPYPVAVDRLDFDAVVHNVVSLPEA